MRRADAETNHRESAIELSLWKKPPSSTLGNGLPHRTQLIHVPLSSPEASRLERLPEEILSMIIFWLSKGDSEGGLAFFALRQVSRHFRRMTEGAEFKTHYFSTHFCCKWCSGGHEDLSNPSRDPTNVRHCFEYNVLFPELKTEVEKLMIRDFACKRCRRVRKAASLFKNHAITCKFQAFDSYPDSWSKCHPCGVEHPKACFARWQLARPKSTCIGRQGHIRLCCHKTLTWDDIKTCIDEGQQGEDRVLLGSCDHEDHSATCSEGQGPQAFATKLPGGMTVVLIFWRGHSGGDPSVFHSSGYLYKKKLKEAIQNIRLQEGRHMIPQRGVNAMAEWDSIAEIDGSESISPDLIKLRGGWASNDPGHPHVCSPFRTLKVACGHCEKEKGCIVMTYIRRICFNMPGTTGGGLPHDWFHAVDQTSYDYSGHLSVPESCRNTSCRFHYGEGMITSYPLVNKAIKKAERTRTTS
ncbi:hypothetical protein FANTH_2130 [Fusarium anthophilum]|uniref:F-box domain-containing protein n=1 Tax=Fusarium anthophilum TaxID=48485 RepID=A0A8H4ZU52_9HYPO|nr:hypothetical protein FANTH_2130 [Fusarium anthophilum]